MSGSQGDFLPLQSKPLKSKGVCSGLKPSASLKPKKIGLPQIARYSAPNFSQIYLCRAGQSARELVPRLLQPREMCTPPVQAFVFLVPAQTLMFCSTVEPLFLYFSCNCVHQFTLRFVCFCPVAKWAHCWHRFQILQLLTFCALSSSSLAFLVCSKGFFLSFFASVPFPITSVLCPTPLSLSAAPSFDKTLLTF